MSDSDSELMNNVFTFPKENTIISARGPNTNVSNITAISFQNNALSSTMQSTRNFEQQRYARSNYDQRSMYRRETSPMHSTMSVCDMRQRGFNGFCYPQGMSSQRSIYNGRNGSIMSDDSRESTASTMASDIAMAFKNMTFNKYDMRIIEDAFKFMKYRNRKKHDRRRNFKAFLKQRRRRYGRETVDQDSDSSLSSGGRSTSTLKENMSSIRSTQRFISDFKRTISESNMYKDCTDNFRHNSFRSMVGGRDNLKNMHTSINSQRTMITGSSMSCINMPVSSKLRNMQSELNGPAMTQKERFNGGFLLPSQRFNRSIASSSIPENHQSINHRGRKDIQNDVAVNRNNIRNIEIDSDQDDLFSQSSKHRTNNNQQKRTIDSDDDIYVPNQKRAKIVSPCKNNRVPIKPTSKQPADIHNDGKSNDFVFARPTFPIKKSAKGKSTSTSTSDAPDTVVPAKAIPPETIQHTKPNESKEQENEKEYDVDQSNTTQNSNERPSFIKRKLFTQKLDMLEKRNTSVDSLNSPQNSIYCGIQKEKHKARKLQQATTQSCMSRDVQKDESNLLDLIHKIVPPNEMNVTNLTNKTDLQCSKNKTGENEDTWDVTSVMSEKRDDGDVSDTYTDEEVFNATVRKLKEMDSKKTPEKKDTVKPSPKKQKGCKIVLERLPDVTNKSVQKCINTFWDTDFESDAECRPKSKNGLTNMSANTNSEILPQKEPPKFQGFSNMFNASKATAAPFANTSTFLNGTSNVQKFNSTSIRIRSHRTPKRKKPDRTKNDDAQPSFFEPQNKKQKTPQETTNVELSKAETKAPNELLNKNSKKTFAKQAPKQVNKKSPKVTKKTSKVDKLNKCAESVKEGTPKKQSNNNKTQPKLAQSTTTTNLNRKETDKCELINKIETNNKQKKSTLKKNNKLKQVEKRVAEPAKNNNNDIKTPQTKNKAINREQDKEPQTKNKLKNNKKEKLVHDTKTKKLTNPAKTKSRNKQLSPQTESNTEDDHNSSRPIRACRISKSNVTLNNSILRCLRSREIDLSATSIGNTTKRNNTRRAMLNVSDVSFSLATENAVAKRAVKNVANSRFFQANNAEDSDVSFTLTKHESSTPKKGKWNRSKQYNEMPKTRPLNNLLSNSKPIRKRIPNKRFLE